MRASLVLALCLLVTGSAAAEKGGRLVVSSYTSVPVGHFEFCKRQPWECGPVPRTSPIKATPALIKLLKRVNSDVNREYRPMLDIHQYGVVELWTYPVDAADCEDYALEKRRRLHVAGIPLSNLLLTVVKKPDGEGHAVLTVRTDRGDVILDNLSLHPSEYQFLKRQSDHDAGKWVALSAGHSAILTSDL